MFTSCVPLLGGVTKDPIPFNTSRSLELKVSNVTGEGDSTIKNQAYSSVLSSWSSDAAYSSWFRLTEEITDPANAVFLEVRIDSLKQTSERRGTRKYGFYTYYESTGRVTLTLIDAQSGSILSSYSSSNYDGSSDGYPGYVGVLNGAIRNSVYGLMKGYIN